MNLLQIMEKMLPHIGSEKLTAPQIAARIGRITEEEKMYLLQSYEKMNLLPGIEQLYDNPDFEKLNIFEIIDKLNQRPGVEKISFRQLMERVDIDGEYEKLSNREKLYYNRRKRFRDHNNKLQMILLPQDIDGKAISFL